MSRILSLWNNRWLTLFLRLLIGWSFVSASLDKIANPALFSKVVYNYDLLPIPFINPFALFLPALEFVAGLLLILGLFPRSQALLIGLLLILFVGALTINIARGNDADCGCFGLEEESPIGWSLVLRDLVLLIGIAQIFTTRQPFLQLDKLFLSPSRPQS